MSGQRPDCHEVHRRGEAQRERVPNSATVRPKPIGPAHPGPGRCNRQEVQVLSMVCNADFSADCNRRLQLYLVRIHILAYVQR
ncbi:hypothetical protein Pen02_79840 [Plantactinospora endophytica]|uniref:Uncharacterized protein n=1 Tax=Plantactinospora endophytica TaxID=673535 RepID=A0ABQ4EEA0_9ACTN|nr:hypothetical protein Pen02_79840 [Plantactinospora endophytica]